MSIGTVWPHTLPAQSQKHVNLTAHSPNGNVQSAEAQ